MKGPIGERERPEVDSLIRRLNRDAVQLVQAATFSTLLRHEYLRNVVDAQAQKDTFTDSDLDRAHLRWLFESIKGVQGIDWVIALDPALFPGAAWKPEPAAGAVLAPWWLRWALAAVPLSLLAWRLRHRLRDRRSYLNRRLPRLPPILTELHLNAPAQLTAAYTAIQHTARSLQVRLAEPSRRLDPEATVRATIRRGGIFTPVNRHLRPPPDYLALIEATGLGDQDAARLKDLVDRLAHAGLAVETFYYVGDPRQCFAELTGSPIPLAELAAGHGSHRLLLLGEAAGFLDDLDFSPHPWTAELEAWERRAWLTPKPLADWGRREMTLAARLALPVGRATVEGITVLAELLGLDGTAERPLYKVHETATAHVRALPEAIRLDRARLGSGAPLADKPWADLKADLVDYLGVVGYRWLCALAIWPQLQWDMTLFLGINLAEEGEALYSEARLVALTQLPWLRDGQMPAWTRRRLIADLPEDYRRRVRSLIWDLVDGKLAKAAGANTIVWRLGTDNANAHRPPGHAEGAVPDLLREQIFVDTLAGGLIPDKDLAVAVPLGQLASGALREWLSRVRLPWPELQAGCIAVALSVGLWLLTPSGGTMLATGALLPQAALLATFTLIWLACGRWLSGYRLEPAAGRTTSLVTRLRRTWQERRESQSTKDRTDGATSVKPATAPRSVERPPPPPSAQSTRSGASRPRPPGSKPRIDLLVRRGDTSRTTQRLLGLLRSRAEHDGAWFELHYLDGDPDPSLWAEQIVERGDVFLVVIDRDWATALDSSGQRRLGSRQDALSAQIALALKHDKLVVPVLIEDARMPSSGDLPERIRGLATLQAARIRPDPSARPDTVAPDVAKLLEDVRAQLDRRRGGAVPRPEPQPVAPGQSQSPSPAQGAQSVQAASVSVAPVAPAYVFLSSGSGDREAMAYVRGVLASNGISVRSNRETTANDMWEEQLRPLLDGAFAVVGIWGVRSGGSEWQLREMAAASEQKKLHVIVIDETDAKHPHETFAIASWARLDSRGIVQLPDGRNSDLQAVGTNAHEMAALAMTLRMVLARRPGSAATEAGEVATKRAIPS